MPTNTDAELPMLRLQQLISPSLPVGAFTYSQGLEWAVECAWVRTQCDLSDWIESLLKATIAQLEVPLLHRLYRATAEDDLGALAYWTSYLLAARETRELHEEERNRGRALASLLPELGIPLDADRLALCRRCFLTGFAHAAFHWGIAPRDAANGYVWSWLENMVLAGVKIIPLGQTAGQQTIAGLTAIIPGIVDTGWMLPDEAIGASCQAQAIASSLHETQYTRIYRS